MAQLSGTERRLGEDPLHSNSDDLAPRYAMLADDSSAEAKKREAAMLFCAAEGHLGNEQIEDALQSAMAALPLFREVGDTSAVHDTLRVIINTQRMEANLEYEDKPAEAERFAKQELAAFEETGDKRGQAAMLLCLAECRCDHRGVKLSQLAEAEGWAQKALDLFQEVADDKMSAISLLELAHIHAMRDEADGVHEKSSRARDLFRSLGDKAGDARALHGVAIADVMDRRLADAVGKMKEALARFRELGIKKQEAFELCVIAEVHLDDEKPLKALPAAREALSTFREINYGKGWEAASLHAVVRGLVGKQQPDLAVKAAQEGVSKLGVQSDRRQEIYGYQILADACLADDRSGEALEACRQAQELAKELDDKRMEMSVMHAMMWVHVHTRDWDKAMDCMDDAANFAEDLEDDYEEALATHNLAFLHLQLGEHKHVLEKVKEACALFEKAESKRGEASALMVAAGSLSDQGKITDAIGKCTQAQDLYRSAKDMRGEFDACSLLAELHLAKEDLESSLQAAERSVELMKQYGNKRLEAGALRAAARVHLEAERPELAEKTALRAKEAASAVQDRAEMTQAQLQLTQAYLALSEGQEAPEKGGRHPLEKAMKSATEAVSLSGRCNDRGLVAIARFVRAQLLNGTGRPDEAQRVAEEALRWFRKAEDGLGEARTLVLQGDIALALNLKEEAKTFAEEAKALARELDGSSVEAEVADLLERIEAKSKVVAAPVAVVDQLVAQAADAPDAGAAAPVVSVAKPEPKGLDLALVKRKVMEMTKNLMAGDDELENDSPFMEAGMDSLSSVQLMSELGKEFQMAMSPSLVFDFPTVNALADHLVEESKATAY